MNNSKQILSKVKIGQRLMSSQSVEVVRPKTAALKEIQKKFTVDDGTPVYKKGGVADKLIFAVTTVSALSGVAIGLNTFYRLVFKN